MARRLLATDSRESVQKPVTVIAPQPGDKVVVPIDATNEVAVLATVLRDHEALDRILKRLRADHFQVRLNREAWEVLGTLRRKGLELGDGAIHALATEEIANYIIGMQDVPSSANLDWHVQNLLWDHARATAARGPLPAFLDALRDPRAEPERVRALARQISQAFDGYEDRKHLLDSREVSRAQMLEIEKRLEGLASYPYGIKGLDYYDDHGAGRRRRMIPGTAPGQITVFTANSGNGKSVLAAHAAIGIAFPDGIDGVDPGRKVCYGAWEMKSGDSLELMAGIYLNWSRTHVRSPEDAPRDAPIHTHEGRLLLQRTMERLGERITFLDVPFRRTTGEKLRPDQQNDRNLDVLQNYLSASGCEVIIADLFKKALRDDTPSAEEDALNRMQAMMIELHMHGILVQQQRLKDVESRPDKRPTREGIKGSGAWVEVPDTIIGVHRPAFWKKVDDTKLEVFILKQRFGAYPLGIEFEWNAEHGMISGGREVEYDRPGEASDFDQRFLGEQRRQPRRRPA